MEAAGKGYIEMSRIARVKYLNGQARVRWLYWPSALAFSVYGG